VLELVGMKKKRKLITRRKARAGENLFKVAGNRVVVYIDAANLEKSVQTLGLVLPTRITKGIIWKADKNLWQADYKKLYRFFKENSKLVGISFYTARFGTKTHDKFLTFLKKSGYRLVTKKIKRIYDHRATLPRRCSYCGTKNEISTRFKCVKCKRLNDVSIERKADFDVEISTDAVSWIENYDTFILFSGDSDFVYLTKFLKKQGKTTVILSRRGHIANELRTSPYVDCYQDIYGLREEFLTKKPNPPVAG